MTNLGTVPSVMLGFCPEVDENWALMGYYAATSGNFLLTFQDNMSVGLLTPEDADGQAERQAD